MFKNQFQRFCSTLKIFKGKKGELISVNHLGKVSESLLSSTVCRLSSDWLVVRWQVGTPGLLCSAWSFLPRLGWGALVPAEELKAIVMYIPWGGTRTLLYHGTIVFWLLFLFFCIPSLFWLAIVWICPLELREGQGGWIKPLSYKQETADMERICTPRLCSVSITCLPHPEAKTSFFFV